MQPIGCHICSSRCWGWGVGLPPVHARDTVRYVKIVTASRPPVQRIHACAQPPPQSAHVYAQHTSWWRVQHVGDTALVCTPTHCNARTASCGANTCGRCPGRPLPPRMCKSKSAPQLQPMHTSSAAPHPPQPHAANAICVLCMRTLAGRHTPQHCCETQYT